MLERILSLTSHRFFKALVLVAALLASCHVSHAQDSVDVLAYFAQAQDARGAGLARKTKPVDVRPAKLGEVVVTTIKGEGKETQSPPAKPGDMVVRNRCPQTGNEEILVAASVFLQRYEGPIGPEGADGWLPYRPRGVQMRFVLVARDGSISFTAPWGERMIAHPGDSIVQDPNNPKDTYRVARAAFACTYEVLDEPRR